MQHNLSYARSEEGFIEYADCAIGAPAIDMHNVLKTGNFPKGLDVLTASDVNTGLLDVQKWMPFAAEEYRTSASLQDYLIVPVTIFYSDMPNSNMAAFPISELSKWNSGAGKVAYKTWEGKPTFEEHANQDTSQARGMIFATALRPVPEYRGNLYRMVLLSGWDRQRHPLLCEGIQEKPTGFSMGAFVTDYHCGVCEASMRKGGCNHLTKEGQIRMQSVGNKLVYRKSINITGFELSKVAIPAWRNAIAMPIG